MTLNTASSRLGSMILLGLALVPGIIGQCIPFPEVNETLYDRYLNTCLAACLAGFIPEGNYSSINDETRRPLGFLRSTVLFNEPSSNPCYSLDNLNARSVEVMFETVPRMVLCFMDQSGQKRCSEGRFQKCQGSSAETMEYTFLCEVSEGCSESDVNFWVRITRGPPQEEDPEGMWCQWRDNLYPESLATLPPSFTPAPTVPGGIGGGGRPGAAWGLTILLATMAAMAAWTSS